MLIFFSTSKSYTKHSIKINPLRAHGAVDFLFFRQAKDDSPLIFLLPGTGSDANSYSVMHLAETYYKNGFKSH